MKLSKRTKLLSLGVVGLAAAAGVGAVAVPSTTTQAKTSDADVVSMLRERSPGLRTAGAETSKFAVVPASATAPVLAPRPAVLAERDAAPVLLPVAATPAPVAAVVPAPVTAIAPQAAAVAPVLIPAAAVPVAAAAASGPGLAAVLPFVPAVFAIGGGGGGITTSDIAPPIPEPKTWMMMITGFGLLGFALRRRRRLERASGRAALQPA